MKKTLLTLALVALPVVAYAQDGVELDESPLICETFADAMDLMTAISPRELENKAKRYEMNDQCYTRLKAKAWVRDFKIGPISCVRPVQDPQCGWVALKKKDERLFPAFVMPEEQPKTLPKAYHKSPEEYRQIREKWLQENPQ